MKSPMMKHQVGDETFNLVQFEWVEARNDGMSKTMGRPIYDKVLRVEITCPGAKNQAVVKEMKREFWHPEGETDLERPPRVRDDLMMEYAEHLRAWEADDTADMTGTPLPEIKGLDVAMIATIKEMGLHSVEALASVKDNHLFPGCRQWREMAQAYLRSANEQKPMSDLISRNQKLEDEIDALKSQVAALTALTESQMAKEPTPAKRGRPKTKAA